MRIAGVRTGIEFERYVRRLLERARLTVSDTPVTGDFGADLLFGYRGWCFAVQCKYYTGSIGLGAVQEIIAALPLYGAHYGAVITNSTFTRAAVTLAQANSVLLIDGEGLAQLAAKGRGIPAFDRFLASGVMACAAPRQSEWTVKDLAARYGVSRDRLMKDFIALGLPCKKVGREYRFEPQAVLDWEIARRRVPMGRDGWMELPGFTEYKEHLKEDLALAQLEHRRRDARQLKKSLRRAGVRKKRGWLLLPLLALTAAAAWIAANYPQVMR